MRKFLKEQRDIIYRGARASPFLAPPSVVHLWILSLCRLLCCSLGVFCDSFSTSSLSSSFPALFLFSLVFFFLSSSSCFAKCCLFLLSSCSLPLVFLSFSPPALPLFFLASCSLSASSYYRPHLFLFSASCVCHPPQFLGPSSRLPHAILLLVSSSYLLLPLIFLSALRPTHVTL